MKPVKETLQKGMPGNGLGMYNRMFRV